MILFRNKETELRELPGQRMITPQEAHAFSTRKSAPLNDYGYRIRKINGAEERRKRSHELATTVFRS